MVSGIASYRAGAIPYRIVILCQCVETGHRHTVLGAATTNRG